MNSSFEDEDDDTFNDLDIPGMESPRKEGMDQAIHGNDDGLSYSDTDQDLSQPEPEHLSKNSVHFVTDQHDQRDGESAVQSGELSQTSRQTGEISQTKIGESSPTRRQSGELSPTRNPSSELSGKTGESYELPHTPHQSGDLSQAARQSDNFALTMVQSNLREAQIKLDKERCIRSTLENRRHVLEAEKSDLIQKLEEITKAKSSLEQMKIDNESMIRNLQYQLREEEEKRKNFEILYGNLRDQLDRKEQQYTVEIEEKQKSELAMRNLQMELRASLSSVKQLEEEKEDLERKLNYERSALSLQEKINEEQIKFHQSLTEEKSERSTDIERQLVEAINKFENAEEGRKQSLDSAEKLKAELYATQMELDRQRSRSKDDHDLLIMENEELQNKVEELKSDIKLNEDALSQVSLKYQMELAKSKTELDKFSQVLDQEKAAKDKSDIELESLKVRLKGSGQELEKEQLARSGLEHKNQKDHEEWSRMIERRESEVSKLKDENQTLHSKLKEVEMKVNRLENELAVANATLVERTNQLATLQRDNDQRRSSQTSLDESLRKEKEDNARLNGKVENLTEQLTSLKHETVSLRTKLDEVHMSGVKSDSNDQFTTVINTLRADHHQEQMALQEKNSLLNERISQINEQLMNSENRRSQMEQELRHFQMDLSDYHRKLSASDMALQTAAQSKEHIETERNQARSEVDKLQDKLQDHKDRIRDLQQRVNELVDRAERAEKEVLNNTQQLSMSQLETEDSRKRLEIEKSRLETQLKQQSSQVEQLKQELHEAHQVRAGLEALVDNFKSTNAKLEEEIHTAAATKTIATHEAEDAKQLWESEVKSRSKLGLRIAQLEREKQETESRTEEEKRKTRKALELKKTAEGKLEAEIEKNGRLNQEIYNLKSQLKAAKKRLKVLDGPDGNYNILEANFAKERMTLEDVNKSLRQQLKSAQEQLEGYSDAKCKLEVDLYKLQDEIKQLRKVQETSNSSEIATWGVQDNDDIDAIRTEMEARSKLEVRETLSEVNKQLDAHAQQQEKLYRMHENAEAQLRRDFERTKRELMDELAKVRANYEKSLAEQENQNRKARHLQDLYENEVKLRENLMGRLGTASSQAQKAAGILENEVYGLPPQPLENTWTLGKKTSEHGVNDLSFKIRQELDRSIAKHLEKGPQIDISVPAYKSDLTHSAFDQSQADYMKTLKRNFFV